MSLVEKQKENLITQRALFLFFHNYTNHRYIIDEMGEENNGFAHAWNKLHDESKELHEKNGGMWIIHDYEIYLLFATKLTYKAQALFIEKVLKAYGEQAKNDIEFSLEIDKKVEEQMAKRKNK